MRFETELVVSKLETFYSWVRVFLSEVVDERVENRGYRKLKGSGAKRMEMEGRKDKPCCPLRVLKYGLGGGIVFMIL